MRRTRLTVGLAVLLTLLPVGAQADRTGTDQEAAQGEQTTDAEDGWGADVGAGNVELRFMENAAREARQAAIDGIKLAPAPPPPAQVLYPACTGNDPTHQIDTMCPGLDRGCPPGEFQVWVFQAPPGTAPGEPGWDRVGTRCSAQAGIGQVSEATVVSEAFFRTLPLPAGGANVQPPNGLGWITKPTIVYATRNEPVVIDTTVGGVPVQVRATPVLWSWDFGDGATVGPTTDPGKPYPAFVNTHTYEAKGTYDIVMTTYYTGEFSVEGGPWRPVDGLAFVDSPPAPFTVQTGHTKLVADNLDP